VRAVIVTRPGGPESLTIREVPDPRPAPGEVVIDVIATAVNRADLVQREGRYPPPAGASTLLGLECSGVVSAIGDGVVGVRVGDAVCALLSGGGYAEKVAVPADQLLPIPPGVSPVAAAALPETTCTVWSMVFGEHAGRLQAGERFLVHGGSSGIGTMAIQLGHAFGATVVATAGTQRKLDACRELGADVAINYREESFEQVIRERTDSPGVDVILDHLGGSYLPDNVASLRVGGRLIVLGIMGGRTGELDLGALLAKRATVHAAGLRARSPLDKAAVVAKTRAAVWPLIAAGAVRPVIDRVIPLHDVAEAHRIVEASDHIGKVVLSVAA
jgi:putative PIG3 family NAD(P)H quinone oxidoreductase